MLIDCDIMIVVGFVGVDVIIDIGVNDVLGDIAGCGREKASAPEFASPVALSDVWKFLLNFTR